MANHLYRGMKMQSLTHAVKDTVLMQISCFLAGIALTSYSTRYFQSRYRMLSASLAEVVNF